MKTQVIFLALIVLAGTPTTARAADEQKAAALAHWTLVLPDDAIPSERYAAEQLQNLLEQALGVRLPMAAAPPQSTGILYVGPGQAMRSSPAGFDTASMGDEDLRIRITPGNIAIAGGRPRGTLYGVYEFAERYLGVRFLTHDHTHVPRDPDRLIPCEDYAYHPPFSFRWSYYHENAAQPAFAAKLRVNTVTHDEKLGGVAPQSLINHSFHRYLPVEKFGKEHPEYFALVDGERKLNLHGGGPEPCVTNPDVIRIITEGVLADLRANPTRKNISVSQNDNDAYCRCETCQAINLSEGTPMGANLHLVNAVAEAVAKEFPAVKVGTLAYWYTRKPPKLMKPRHNVQIQLCSIECCVTHPLDDPSVEKNRAFAQDLKAWGAICSDIWIWHYNTNFAAYDLPFPNLRPIGDNLRFFQDNNVHGVFMQANGNGNAGELSDLRNYVIARGLWDPSLDSWALAEEFCRLHYAEAATPILQYLDYIHGVAQNSGFEPNCFGTAEELGLTPAVANRALDYFDKALDCTDDPVVRHRVEKASICAYRAMIETGGRLEYAEGKVHLLFPKGRTNTLDRYADLCETHHMSMAAERIPLPEYLANARRRVQGMPAARLENDTWRLTCLPEENGKIIEMRHKPTGRDLLATWPRAGVRESGGTFEERGETGLAWSMGAFEAHAEGDTALLLTLNQPEGARVERRVTLDGARVRFHTTITHQGTAAQAYQVRIHPEWDMVATSGGHETVTAYIRGQEGWKAFNQDWERDHGPNDALLRSEAGGGFAFFNHQAGFGIVETYDPEELQLPRLWCEPGRHQLNLELFTPGVELAPGDSFSYGYTCALLDSPPAG